jgi:hypothetical protein
MQTVLLGPVREIFSVKIVLYHRLIVPTVIQSLGYSQVQTVPVLTTVHKTLIKVLPVIVPALVLAIVLFVLVPAGKKN